MKLVAAFLSVVIQTSLAQTVSVAGYGACIDMSIFGTDPPQGADQGFHCHLTSASCLQGEEWFTPTQTTNNDVQCGCDEDYQENVFVTGCWLDGEVTCAADPQSCPLGASILDNGTHNGSRFNGNQFAGPSCVEGEVAFGAFGPLGCGKQCKCNYDYKSGTNIVQAGSTQYGKCYNPTTNIQYCAATSQSCTGVEEYRGPHSSAFSGPVCNCDRTLVGACVTGTMHHTFVSCAVAADSCGENETFLTAAQVVDSSDVTNDCRLCVNTWDELQVSPAPTATVTAPPTSSPTVSAAPTVSSGPSFTPPTGHPTPEPPAVALYGSCVSTIMGNDDVHCHFTSDSCIANEMWLSPTDTAARGISCTCDDDYNNNVFATYCFNTFTGESSCAADPGSCAMGDMKTPGRFNADLTVSDTCRDGTQASPLNTMGGCGLQCRCNYDMRSDDNFVRAGTTQYGKCYNAETNIQYCAATSSSCTGEEEYRGPNSSNFSGPECNCDRTLVGACVSNEGTTFEHCAVAADSCAGMGDTFLTATQLRVSPFTNDCRLCVNTWDEPQVSPAPTATVTAPPTSTPTVSAAPTVSRAPVVSMTGPTTIHGTSYPTSAPVSTPTSAPFSTATISPTSPQCINDLKFRINNNDAQSCVWIAKRQDRITTLCKNPIVADNCNVLCGRCCADNLSPRFDDMGNKRSCNYLRNNNRRREFCTSRRVRSICPLACGACCLDNDPNCTAFGVGPQNRVRRPGNM